MDRFEIGSLENKKDLDRIMEIWLEVNLEAHDFIDRSYWQDNYSYVRELIGQAEVYSIGHKEILGFMGLVDGYIAGIFISKSARGQGLGSTLIDRAKKDHEKLSLDVYRKNKPALDFYLARGFVVLEEKLDPVNKQVECFMTWETSLK